MNSMHSSDSDSQIMVFTGNANPKLAQAVVEHLQLSLGVASVGSFSDGEVQVEIEENVRGKDVFVIQPTCAPTNDNLMELLVMIDAVRRSSARSVLLRWCRISVMRARIAVHDRHVFRSRPRWLRR